MTIRELELKTGRQVIMRSCWKCNKAHERLKNEKGYIIYCISCGRLYLKGKPFKLKGCENDE